MNTDDQRSTFQVQVLPRVRGRPVQGLRHGALLLGLRPPGHGAGRAGEQGDKLLGVGAAALVHRRLKVRFASGTGEVSNHSRNLFQKRKSIIVLSDT